MTLCAFQGSDNSLPRQTERCLTNLALPVNSATPHCFLYSSYNEFQCTSDEVMKSLDREFEIYLIMHYIDREGRENMLPSGERSRVFVFTDCCCQVMNDTAQLIY